MLQDWDKTGIPDIKQTPIGGDSIIEWAIRARATYNRDKKEWKPNFDESQLVKPPTPRSEPKGFAPRYFGYIGSGKYNKGEYDETNGCYRLFADPY